MSDLGQRIEAAQAQAVADLNSLGITDDTPGHVLVGILGRKWRDRTGADAIREAKEAARMEVLAGQ